jgi:sulfur carrier protein
MQLGLICREVARLEIIVNGEPLEVADGLSIAALLAQLSVTSRGVAVEVNLELVPRSRHVNHSIVSGDHIEVVTLVGGG